MTSSVFWISDSFDRIYWSGTMQQRTEGKIEGTMLLSSVSIDESTSLFPLCTNIVQ